MDVLNDSDSRNEPDDEIETDMDGDENGEQEEEYEELYERQPVSAKSARPSLLEGLRSYNPDRKPSALGKKASELDI